MCFNQPLLSSFSCSNGMHNVIEFVIFTSWQRWKIAFKCYRAFDKGMLFKIYFPLWYIYDFDECTLNIKPNIIIFTCPFYFEGLIRSVKYLCSYWNNLFWPNYLTNIHFQVAIFENIFSLSVSVNILYIILYTWGLKYMIVSISSFLEIQFNFGRSFLEKK